MTPQTLILRYASFAVLATIANLAAQRAVLAVLPGPNAIFAAMLAGAVLGLAVKYALDRKFIFAPTRAASVREFLRYAATGGILTGIFFICEYTLWRLFESDIAREAGAVLGLVIGYCIKYQIDRTYVFTEAALPLTEKMRHNG